MNEILLSTACWPNLEYFFHVMRADQLTIEVCDNYEKQTFRNRYAILTANGPMSLTVPVVHTGTRQVTRDVKIFYGDRWRAVHWGALTSAYRRSPYFEYFEDDISRFYTEEFESLVDQNLQQLSLVIKLLQIKKEIKLTGEYEPKPIIRDLRYLRTPERDFKKDPEAGETLSQTYYQTFGDRSGFVPNLSVLDLLFNVGLKGKNYLEANIS